jgi:hypothetical protein
MSSSPKRKQQPSAKYTEDRNGIADRLYWLKRDIIKEIIMRGEILPMDEIRSVANRTDVYYKDNNITRRQNIPGAFSSSTGYGEPKGNFKETIEFKRSGYVNTAVTNLIEEGILVKKEIDGRVYYGLPTNYKSSTPLVETGTTDFGTSERTSTPTMAKHNFLTNLGRLTNENEPLYQKLKKILGSDFMDKHTEEAMMNVGRGGKRKSNKIKSKRKSKTKKSR